CVLDEGALSLALLAVRGSCSPLLPFLPRSRRGVSGCISPGAVQGGNAPTGELRPLRRSGPGRGGSGVTHGRPRRGLRGTGQARQGRRSGEEQAAEPRSWRAPLLLLRRRQLLNPQPRFEARIYDPGFPPLPARAGHADVLAELVDGNAPLFQAVLDVDDCVLDHVCIFCTYLDRM